MQQPYNTIECVIKAKVLGRIMADDGHLVETISDRTGKSNIPWELLRIKFIKNIR